jgi:hypothetical protein
MLSLTALVWAAGGAKHKGLTPFSIVVNGKEVKQGEVTEISLPNVLSGVRSKAFTSGRRKAPTTSRPRFKPQLEYLEDRLSRPHEKVNVPDLISVRSHLDQCDLLAAEAFDSLLPKLAHELLDAGK